MKYQQPHNIRRELKRDLIDIFPDLNEPMLERLVEKYHRMQRYEARRKER